MNKAIVIASLLSLCMLIQLSFPDPSRSQALPVHENLQVTRAERRLGPFEIGGESYTVIIGLQRIVGAPEGFEETVDMCSIVDGRGKEHYRKSFDVAAGQEMFEETVGLGAYALESGGRKIFRSDRGQLEESVVDEGKTVGLLLSYGFLPSAPSSGSSCQVFTPEGGLLLPRFPPLTVYGNVYDLPNGSRSGAKRLFEGDTMKFGVWTGWFEVTVPVEVLEGLRVVPLHRQLTFGLDAFPVVVDRAPRDEETFVRLFRSPDDSTPGHVIVKRDSNVEFLWAYTRVTFDSGLDETGISVDEMPWLKVRIDGEEGFVREAEDLMALGLRPAG